MKSYKFRDIVDNSTIRTEMKKITGCLYRIHQLSNGKNYIGICKNLYSRFYGVWGYISKIRSDNDLSPIHIAIKSYGYDDFELIVEFEGNYELAINQESEFIKKYNSVNNGYNMTTSGRGGRKDLIYMNNGTKNIRIHRSLIDDYLELGYSIGQLKAPNAGKIHVIKGDDLRFIYKDQIDEYLSLGYRLGSKSKPKTKKVNNGVIEKKIPLDKLQEYLNNNPTWKLGGLPWSAFKGRNKNLSSSTTIEKQ